MTDEVKQQQQTKPQMIAKFFVNDLKGALKRKGLDVTDRKTELAMEYLLQDNNLPYMFDLLWEGHIDRQTMRLWVLESFDTLNKILDFLEYVEQRNSKQEVENDS